MNKTWYEQVKEDFTKNINDTYTLNLAMSILEDRKELLDKNADLKQRLNVVNEMNVANYNKYCEVLKENQQLEHILDELEKWLNKYPSEVWFQVSEIKNKIKELRGRENE